jgi:outer membrane protein OmpA-like peptidoglycan-associated protein
MKLRTALLASAMMALPIAAANAQAIDGMYIGGGLGVNFMQRESITLGAPINRSGDVRVNLGPAVVASLGWGFGNGLRAEVEASYRQNNGFSNPQGYGFPGAASGKEQKVGGMVNVLYDFVGMPVVQPYIGAGIGYQDVVWQGVGASALAGGSANAQTSNRGSLAYQGILGVAVPIASAPGLAVTAEYRFMGLTGDRTWGPALPGGPSFKSTNDYNHSVLFGLRYAFGVAPVPVAPTPVAEVGAKTFMVFFDWDKANLTSRSEGIVRDAAAYSTHSQYTRIDVNGNTDTSGTAQYNMGLSERRARVVAAELVRDGVPQTAIDMHAYGETHLLVPTGPNVREPQNRRVEIVYH